MTEPTTEADQPLWVQVIVREAVNAALGALAAEVRDIGHTQDCPVIWKGSEAKCLCTIAAVLALIAERRR